MAAKIQHVFKAMCLISFFTVLCCNNPLHASRSSNRYSAENYLSEIATDGTSLKCLFDYKTIAASHTFTSADILIIDSVISSRLADSLKNERLLVLLSRFKFKIEGHADLRNSLLGRAQKSDSFHAELFSRLLSGAGPGDDGDAIAQNDFLSLASKYKLTRSEINKECIYQLIKQGRENDALALLEKDPGLLPAMLDACTMNTISASMQKRLVDATLASQDRYVQWVGLRFIATVMEAGDGGNVSKLYASLAEIDEDGQAVITTSTTIRDPKTILFHECNRYLKLSKYMDVYKKSLSQNVTDGIFSVSFDDRDIAELQGMILFQSQPRQFPGLLGDYIQSNKLVLEAGMPLSLILSAAARFDSMTGNVRGFGDMVRGKLSAASSPVVQANLLKVLKVVVNNADLPLLKKLCAVEADVAWVTSSGEEYKNAIVGLWAIDCLWSLGTPEANGWMRSVSEDKAFRSVVREFAGRIVASQEKK